MAARAEPRATSPLQLTPDFGLAQAPERAPYLRDLGVSHLYLSPALQARPGSTHGYDVIDPGRLSSDLGGREEFERLADGAHGSGPGRAILRHRPGHGQVAALLRHHRPRGRSAGGPDRVRADSRAGAFAGAR